MGRHANPTAAIEAPALIGPDEAREIDARIETGAAALNAEALLRKIVKGGPGEALLIAGQLQMATALATVADSAALSVFERAKETKVYRFLPSENCDIAGMTLDEFCETYLGRSYRRMQEILRNKRALGEDLYEKTEQLGFRARDYRLIQSIPDDDRAAAEEAIRDAAEHGDRDAALAVLAELVTRHREARDQAEADRDAAIAARDSMQQDYLASTRLLGETKTQLRRMQDGGDVPQIDEQMAAWPKVGGYLTGEIRGHLTRLLLMIEEAERRVLAAEPYEDSPAIEVVRRACQMLCSQLDGDLANLKDEVWGVQVRLDRIIGVFGRGENPEQEQP